MNDNTTTNTLSDDELDARLCTTFATIMPLLDPASTATTSTTAGDGSERIDNDDALIFDLAAAPSSPNPRRMVGILGAAAATTLVVAGLSFAQRNQTETPVASQPVELPSASQPAELPVSTVTVPDTTIPGQGGPGGSLPDGAVDEVLPPKLTLKVDGWEIAAGDLGDRSVSYQFVHLDGRQLDVTVEAGGVDVYLDRIATLSPDAVETINDVSQVAALATIGGFQLDALLEPGSDWVLQVVGAGFTSREDFVATVTALEQSLRTDG